MGSKLKLTIILTGIAQGGSQDSFHPNDFGHIMLAKKIHEETNWESLETYNICEDGESICPKTGESASKPEVPENLGGKAKNSRDASITQGTVIKGETGDYMVVPYTFKPGTTIVVAYFSSPTYLGTFVADSVGGLNTIIPTPSTLPVGYHILSLEGTSFMGDPIEITQTVAVLSNNPEDRDGNGISDNKQACGLFLEDNMCDSSALVRTDERNLTDLGGSVDGTKAAGQTSGTNRIDAPLDASTYDNKDGSLSPRKSSGKGADSQTHSPTYANTEHGLASKNSILISLLTILFIALIVYIRRRNARKF